MSPNLFDINNLTKQFLCCAPINTLDLIIPKQTISYFINLNRQREILESTVNNNLIKKYPIKRSYQRAFLKWLMNKIEESGCEIHDDMYITYCNLISSTFDEFTHYRHFLLEDKEGSVHISLHESTNIISEGTTGLCIWQGALELGKWCIENSSDFDGKVILELGCGVGLTGLCVIRKCFPKQYVFTDCHNDVLDMVSKNVKFNLLPDKKTSQVKLQSKINRLKLEAMYGNTSVQIMELNWEDIHKYINEQWVIPDIIIGADILYEADAFPILVSGLKALLSFNNRYAIIAGMVRNEDTISQFLHQLELNNLAFEECSIPKQVLRIQVIDSPVKILKIFQKR
ncbi:protein-lysine N-methyltransferase EEF2KMT [Andrena cerasifolii]|uniref:protein-lysine N-methyltransferase EEF2KMT n=1 Tax=Andrena cerasifolii TaxID=2819439 RepID=UPI004037E93C